MAGKKNTTIDGQVLFDQVDDSAKYLSLAYGLFYVSLSINDIGKVETITLDAEQAVYLAKILLEKYQAAPLRP